MLCCYPLQSELHICCSFGAAQTFRLHRMRSFPRRTANTTQTLLLPPRWQQLSRGSSLLLASDEVEQEKQQLVCSHFLFCAFSQQTNGSGGDAASGSSLVKYKENCIWLPLVSLSLLSSCSRSRSRCRSRPHTRASARARSRWTSIHFNSDIRSTRKCVCVRAQYKLVLCVD